MTRYYPLLTMCVALAAAGPAAAHGGHVGELAGHSHWLGWAAVAGAIAIAVWAGKRKARKDKAADEADAGSKAEKAEA